MADIRCPACGKNNPDFLDVCQFCQTPLKSDSMLQIGENPTKKNTGELEPILPEWLRDVRKQARESAEEEAAISATRPQVQRDEAPDLLAGLASQNDDEDDEIPDWLASINPVAKPKPSVKPASEQPSIDFFAQFQESKPAPAKASEPLKEELPAAQAEPLPSPPEEPSPKDDLSEWFLNASKEPDVPSAFEPGAAGGIADWMSHPEPTDSVTSSAPEEKEDLSWLHNLEASAKQSESKQESGWNNEAPPPPSVSQEDLSWLNNLGGTSAPSQPAAPKLAEDEDLSWLNSLGGNPVPPASSQPSSKDDLSWLNDLGGTTVPSQPTASQPSQDEDLSWLNALGGTPVPSVSSQPAAQEDLGWMNDLGGSKPDQSTASQSSQQDDMGWLNTLGGTTEPTQPEPSLLQTELDWLKDFASSSEPPQTTPPQSAEPGWFDTFGSTQTSQPAPSEPTVPQEDLDWLASLGAASASASPSAKPFGTTDELNPPKGFDDGSAHISPFVPRKTAPLSGEVSDNMPDWLREATETTPDLPLGTNALEQFRDASHKPVEETPLRSTPEPASAGSNVFSSSSDSLSNKDVDSLFSLEMPDWLSQSQPESPDLTSQNTESPSRAESLAPVDLPSWVQAMRPVESVIGQGPSVETQPTETEGPLAGLRGVIPSAPIGSARRPKAISLKLQASEEQQAGASLFDQILAGETLPAAMAVPSTVASQRVLRQAISGVMIVILSAVLFMRSQLMPVSAALPADVSAAIGAINAIPDNSSVLVVVDYEPSLTGEMEAVAAPVLNQLILAHQPKLVLISTSATSAGLIERLLASARITASDGFAYTSGNQYFNLGYLPGGSAGIVGFLTSPNHVTSAAAKSFSEYSAVVVLTDHAESGRVWVEQLDVAKQTDPALVNQPVILVTSAQAGPLLQPYVSSKQAAGMVNGLADAARFEYANAIPEANRIARQYWDAFGIGILMAVILMIIGSVWSLVIGFRARRVSGEQG